MKISIVTPSFRQLEYLKCCVASVGDQRGAFEVEHRIQDGGSGAEFVAWAEQQPRLIWRSEQDAGMYDAINRGFRAATGDVVAWLNCDEQYLPGALEAVAERFRREPDLDLLFGDVVITAVDGTPLSYRKALVPARGYIRACHLPTFSAATFVRRRVIAGGNLLDERWRAIADAVWIDGLLGRGFRAGTLDRPLALFTRTGENLGETPAAREELLRWRAECGADSRLLRAGWALRHRLRKWWAGAYRPLECAVELHLAGHDGRVMRWARVGERWQKHP